MKRRTPLLLAALAALPLSLSAQPPAKAKAKAAEVRPPDADTRKQIEDGIRHLYTRRNEPTLKTVPDGVWAEVEVYAKAADWVLRHGEWYGDTAKQTLPVLREGTGRAYTLATGHAPWRLKPGA